ncbi:murein hydrolase activator EnvC family protein [Paenibacillus sp. GCM10027627]|uniref:murein hydrolase activator EnvC family protein n=1 Tax=unclassified Paenibacillus TaxID=185978 RepID=UPI00363AED9D
MTKVKKVGTFIVATAMLAVFALQPTGGGEADAASLSQIEKDIKAANQQMRDAERKQANAAQQARAAETKKTDLSNKKEDLEKEITSLIKEIETVTAQKNKKQEEMEKKQAELIKTGKELEKAEKRVIERTELLENRMRTMYTNGFVSYMDVLLSATSFTDFLDRFDALQTILSSDRDILETHKKDKELVEQKKADVELQYAGLETIYQELELQQADLRKKESDKEVLIASYNENIGELNETLEYLGYVSEEQQQLVVQLAAKISKLQAEKNRIKNPYSGGKLGMPIKDGYRVSSNFGSRVHPITGKRHTHTGMDFAAPQGTAIYAAEAGVVITSRSTSGYGNCIIIDHGNGLWTLYAHIRVGGLLVEEGETVKKGQKIAEVGNTGNSTGPHLHFEVRKNEVPVNPSGYLK